MQFHREMKKVPLAVLLIKFDTHMPRAYPVVAAVYTTGTVHITTINDEYQHVAEVLGV